MARIRTIKPEFWQDEKLAPLDAVTRLVFVGLISQADDAGRLVDSVRMLDGLLFPFTDETCAEPLATLAELGVIRRGKTASGQPIIQVLNWHHQKIDRPNLSSALPEIVNPDGTTDSDSSSKDRRSVGEESSTHISIGISTNDQRSTTADQTREADGRADPVAEMVQEFEEFFERTEPDTVKRSRQMAKARLIAKGEDRAVWDDPTGNPAPFEERPRILRLALARVEAGESDTIRGALKISVAQQLDPDRVRSAVKGEAQARASPPTPETERTALDRLREQHPDAYADALAEFEGYGWWKGTENLFCADQLAKAVREKVSRAA